MPKIGNQSQEKNPYLHPVFDLIRFRINTPEINELRDNLTKIIWTGATGAVIMGFTRAGKTTALEMIEQSLKTRSGQPIPVLRYSVHRRDQQRIRSLAQNICVQFDLRHKSRDTAEMLVETLLEFFSEKAAVNRTNQIVLTVDEAQRLAIHQIDLFAELYDKLRSIYSITLTCIFIGNKEQVQRLLDDVHSGYHEHIEGRFFRNSFCFSGLRSQSDVKFCLNQYDKLRYPDSGPTYTEYFLPKEYAEGFRLSSLAESIWEAFRTYKKELKLTDWGMEYFVRSVNTLLVDYLPKYGAQNYSVDMFHRCIDISGLVPNISIVEIK